MKRTLGALAIMAFGAATVVGGPVPEATAKVSVAAPASSVNAATAEGAREVIARYASALLEPAFLVESRAKATCVRYLATAKRTIDAEGAPSCKLQLRATKALAMCRWFEGRYGEARTLAKELALARCQGGKAGLADAVWLAVRWWRPELVRRLVAGQRDGHPARARQLARLEAVKDAAVATRAALGKDYPRAGLLIRAIPHGAPAARTGMRPGDVLVSVAARPVRRPADVAKHLADRATAYTSILYYRDGQRIEASWPGTSAGKFDGMALPERLP